MTNALKELEPFISSYKIKAAVINYHPSTLWNNDEYVTPHKGKQLFLKVGHTIEELEEFFFEMDFLYDAGWGSQELHGTIWFETTDSWLTRGEYDGSEWWDLNYMPEIPKELVNDSLSEADFWDGDESDKSAE